MGIRYRVKPKDLGATHNAPHIVFDTLIKQVVFEGNDFNETREAARLFESGNWLYEGGKWKPLSR